MTSSKQSESCTHSLNVEDRVSGVGWRSARNSGALRFGYVV